MNNNDKKTLIVFAILVILIVGIFVFNNFKDKKIDNIDRKVTYIFNNLTYDGVYNASSKLFLQAIDLLNKRNVFEYEKDNSGNIKYYAINNHNQYRKIQNFVIVSNTFAKEEVIKYMDYKKIIKYENSYYIETYTEELNQNYVGSILDIDTYNDKYVYFKSINYYCENSNYLGLLDEEPNCSYTSNKTNFTIVLENNNLRINDLEEIKNIMQ